MNPLESAVATILAMSEEEVQDALKIASEDELQEIHSWMGAEIRNLLGIWDESSPLVAYFRGRGIEHPDDMSLEVLVAVRAKLRGDIMSEENKDGYIWCLHCERTYKPGEQRKVPVPKAIKKIVDGVEFFEECAYEDCDGSADIDAWDWERVREHNPTYPEVPEPGKTYPLYGE